MHVASVYIDGFKKLRKFTLTFNDRINVLVGDNETGKSSILEALHLALSRQHDGRIIDYAIDPYMFNDEEVAQFFKTLRANKNASPPRILVEAYLSDDPATPQLSSLKGRNNSKGEDCPGMKICIELDPDHVDDLKEYVRDTSNPEVIPIEYYRCHWRSFADNGLSSRSLPFRSKLIDTSLAKTIRGPSRYIAQLVSDVLSEDQRRNMSLAYKKLRHGFSQQDGVTAINDHLKKQGDPASTKPLSVQMDLSSRTSWDTGIVPHLGDLPFDCAGKGAMCRIQMRLAIADSDQSRVFLIEEPENHLSHSNLNLLMEEIQTECGERQVILTTHSGFVLNKLGLDNLKLISPSGRANSLTDLTEETRDYFMKLPGYDTLRLILSQKCILVEGPSDELIVQRAYVEKHGKMPLADGVDVISVGSLAFKRFLEIAALLSLKVCVVTDNDGDLTALKEKYSEYIDGQIPTIRICYDADTLHKTLEPQLLKANSLELLNAILGTKHKTKEKLLSHMEKKKTDCALKMFESSTKWTVPEYIHNAIN